MPRLAKNKHGYLEDSFTIMIELNSFPCKNEK